MKRTFNVIGADLTLENTTCTVMILTNPHFNPLV